MPEVTVFGELFWTVILVLACGFPVFFLLCVAGGVFYERVWKRWIA
jgi:hypothetical protein